jgi:hypothetical protein
MTPFEYVTVLVSIVLGLGITQIVTGTADIIHHWERVKIYWPHLLWILLIFFLHLQEWWILFGLRQHQTWRLAAFFFTILYPINLFILARILFPVDQPPRFAEELREGKQGTIDMKAFYFGNYRKFFLLAAFLPAISFIDNVFMNGLPVSQQFIHFGLFAVMMAGAVRGFQKEWVHKLIVSVFVLIVLGSVIVNWDEWTLSM